MMPPTILYCGVTQDVASPPQKTDGCLTSSHKEWGKQSLKAPVFLKIFYLFLDRGEGREKERERNINVWLPLTCPALGTWPTTQAWALTGNQTSDPLVHRPALNPLSHTSQGQNIIIFHMSRLSLSKSKSFVQDHTASKQWSHHGS